MLIYFSSGGVVTAAVVVFPSDDPQEEMTANPPKPINPITIKLLMCSFFVLTFSVRNPVVQCRVLYVLPG